MKDIRSILALVYAFATLPLWLLLLTLSIATLSILDAWVWLGYRILGTRGAQ